MARFGLLVRESANRVYDHAGPRLLAAELRAVSAALHASVTDVGSGSLGGVEYVFVDADRLDDHDLFVVSNLSTVRAVFEVRGDGSLIPLVAQPLRHFDSDLLSIQRYPGKTNEQFTHLLVNVTVAASRAAHERAGGGEPIRLLDPVAGRGTTLNRALMYGFDATGIELAQADVDQYRAFITTYLQDHRVKHTTTKEKIRKGPLAGTSSVLIRIGGGQRVQMVRGDCSLAAELLAGQKFDVVVGDLPYGVQHRAAAASTARSPYELVEASLVGWRALMRGRAAIGLSWNLRTMPRDAVVALLVDAGFTVVDHPASFEHVVDRSITRDLVVATR